MRYESDRAFVQRAFVQLKYISAKFAIKKGNYFVNIYGLHLLKC